ncbi:hypothetical protein KAI87_15765 [Myxococcota bacterium]|nr:hypothetical protein [Myxococcota bacterium]
MKKNLLLILAIVFFSSCKSTTTEHQKEPAQAKENIQKQSPIPTSTPRAEPTKCATSRECFFDDKQQKCKVTKGEVKQILILRAGQTFCYCTQEGECVPKKIEPTKCKQDNECGIGEIDGFTYPIKLKKKRKHKLRPCEGNGEGDGSEIPACIKGQCQIEFYLC